MNCLKFKAYLCNHKKIIDVVSLYLEVDGTFKLVYKDVIISSKDIGLMTFTGKYDRNGEEIYSKQIVICDGEYCFIDWDDSTARFQIVGNGWCASFDNYDASELEVVGNVFQNDDLLEIKYE